MVAVWSVYNVAEMGDNYAWIGTEWNKKEIPEEIDLNNIIEK